MRGRGALYGLLMAGVFAFAAALGWTTLAAQIDSDVYDFLFRLQRPKLGPLSSVIYGIDERTLTAGGGLPNLRGILAEGVERLAACGPKALLVDIVLADRADEANSERLAKALAKVPYVVLATDLTARHGWEQPLEIFPRKAVGHVHADPDPYDNVVRQIPLEKISGRERHWALSLEALRAMEPGLTVEEDPRGLTIGGARLPGKREDGRPMLVKFGEIPEVTLAELAADAGRCAELRGKAAFLGLTAQSAAQDRHPTPLSFGESMVGVAIHANAYETLAQRAFLRVAGNTESMLFALALTAGAAAVFYFLSGWAAYALAAALLAATHLVPWYAFRAGIVFPYTAPLLCAWLGTAAAATFQYFSTRRALRKAEADRSRYQEAIHFVAHEMRSPLTAIQGSSELMGRYQLPEEKRAQMARMINSESKRLARMIQTFLDVERLSEGQMELKREAVETAELARVCVDRARPLAERKRIGFTMGAMEEATITGDRELMEYALYNLLTNAVKYSPAGTEVTVEARREGASVRLSVKDQGVGIEEADLKRIFQKFYRTGSAEKGQEAGTGIGLSIVEQIVSHHGGRIEVESSPGAGSRFTIVVPVQDRVPAGGR
jgi:signal transduction histidine kinase